MKSLSSPAPNWAAAARSLSVNKKKQRVLIEGLKMIKRHTRKSDKHPQGGIVEREGTHPHFQCDAGLALRWRGPGRNRGTARPNLIWTMKPRLYEKYINEVRPALKEKRKYQNVHQIPRMEKIVVNMGVSASLEKGAVDDATRDMAMITGRKPVINKARHSIANFKLREGQNIGCRVTLRREAMYEFFDRLVAAALPRIRDFRGLSPRSFDGRGNYTLGVVGPDHLSRNRTGQNQTHPRHGHHDRDQRADQRRRRWSC